MVGGIKKGRGTHFTNQGGIPPSGVQRGERPNDLRSLTRAFREYLKNNGVWKGGDPPGLELFFASPGAQLFRR